MNTDEMIAVMQAYARGEAIEVSDKGAGNWSEIKCPLWDWNSFEYRIKPKKSKFKADEILVRPTHECTPLRRCDIYRIIETTDKITAENRNGIKVQFDYDDLDVDFVKADDVLWYWEYQDADDHWEKWDYRATRAEIEKLSNFHNFTPLYALGFRLSQNLKDEK